MKKEITNVAASVKAQLLTIAKTSGKPYDELLKMFAMERLLYRFSKSHFKNILTLKGALIFFAYDIPGRRTTLDADFLAKYDNNPEKIAKIVKETCLISVEDDGIKFDPDTIVAVKIKEKAEYPGVRVKLTAYIEKTRIPVQIDFGFGDVIYPKAEKIEYPSLLGFPSPKLKGYPPESIISEKFEIIIKLGELNSRMKDFYDIWLIFRNLQVDNTKLAKAIEITFKNRKTNIPHFDKLFSEDIYNKESDRQKIWSAFLIKNNIKDAPGLLHDIAIEIEKQLIKSIKFIKKGNL